MNQDSCNMTGRRRFLKQAGGMLGTLSLGLSDVVQASTRLNKQPKLQLKKDDIILFQGDSITDAFRDRNEKGFNRALGLGTGYALQITSRLLQVYPSLNLKFYNRGISGHKTINLLNRWKEDTIDLNPTVLSILIGVNDFWVPQKNGERITVTEYEDNYRQILEQTKKELPKIRLIIGEPFGFDGIEGSKHKVWPAGFEGFQAVARKLAFEYSGTLVPYQLIFDKALKRAPKQYWTRDGVHPSIAGAQLMADAWMDTIKINNRA